MTSHDRHGQYHAPKCTVDLAHARYLLGIDEKDPSTVPEVALVLGLGWDETIPLDGATICSLEELPSFEGYPDNGQKRQLIRTTIAGKTAVALSGRIRMGDSPCDPYLPALVRIQMDMLCQLGAKTLFLTNSACQLEETFCKKGDVMAISQTFRVYDDTLPLWGTDEYPHLDEIFRPKGYALICKALKALGYPELFGTCAMGYGPFVESKDLYSRLKCGVKVISGNLIPELCIASLNAMDVLGLSYVSCTKCERLTKKEIERRVQADSCKLSNVLREVISRL